MNIIITADHVISSSARKRRKCWSEMGHNESIDELFDRLAANTPPTAVVAMDTNNSSSDDDVTSGSGQDHVIQSAVEGDHISPNLHGQIHTYFCKIFCQKFNVEDLNSCYIHIITLIGS